jgi:hypothetical protein
MSKYIRRIAAVAYAGFFVGVVFLLVMQVAHAPDDLPQWAEIAAAILMGPGLLGICAMCAGLLLLLLVSGALYAVGEIGDIVLMIWGKKGGDDAN